MEIFAVKILKNINQANFYRLIIQLDEDKKQIIGKIKNVQMRLETLTSALFIDYIVKNKSGSNTNQIKFAKNKYGKPRLMGRSDFHFNLSYSGDWAVCVIDTKPVGIDIEKVDHKNPKIVSGVLSPVESAMYKKLRPNKRVSFFYTIWTRKESYLKALGIGLNAPLDSLTVYSENKEDFFSPVIKNSINEKYFLKQYFVFDCYAMAVCATTKNFADKIVFINRSDLFKTI